MGRLSDVAIVLVHGSWIGPDAWRPVVEFLEGEGADVRVVDRRDPGRGGRIIGDMPSNVARVREVLDGIDGPVVLCGHSAGGGIITRAACGRPTVRELVYIAGFMTRGREVPLDLGGEPSAQFKAAMRVVDRDTVAVDPVAGQALFFHDCAPEVRRAAACGLLAQQIGVRRRRGGFGAAWQERPSTYVVCSEDRAQSPKVQREVAQRATRVVILPTGHTPQLSRPDLVATLLKQRAQALL